MRHSFLLLVLCSSLFACKKERDTVPVNVHPEMRYSDLGDSSVSHGFRKVDLNGDGRSDLHFKVQMVADGALQVVKKQFCVRSEIGSNLLVNEQNETPALPLLEKIEATRAGFEWYEVSESVLAEKLSGLTEAWWDGLWKNVERRYLPVQVAVDGKIYHGWVELSIDRNTERVVLHRAGISTEAGRAVRAGE